MARTLKKGLDFFHFDTSFYEDIKIRKLIRYQGAQAVVVYQLILIRIYNEGYYLKWDDDLPFIVAEVSHLEDKYVKEAIDFCIEIGLFDKDIFDTDKVLTSRGIQNRFFDFCVVAKRKIATETPYLLIDLASKAVKVSSVSTKIINSEKTGINSEEILFNSEEIDNSTEETPINSGFGTQSKGKESKDNNSLRSSLSPSSPPTPAHMREGQTDGDDDETPTTARDGVELLKHDRDWKLQMQRKFGLDAGTIVCWLDGFVLDCDCRGKQEHESLSDIKQHFNDWMTKQVKKPSGKKGDTPVVQSPTFIQRWNKCQAELCQSVSADVSRKSFERLLFESFIKDTGELYVQVPDKETYKFIETNLTPIMSRIIPKYFGTPFKLNYCFPKKSV